MSIASKTIAGFVSIVFVASALTFAPVKAQSNLEDLSIDELIALIEQLTRQRDSLSSSSSSSSTSSSSCSYTFTRNLVAGDRGEDVRQLQILLNSNPATVVASSGPGSNGQETTYYGPATARAVSKFQEVYASDILTPLGLTSGTGNFYTSTIRKANSLCTGGGSTSRPSTSRPTFVGTGDITVRGASNQIRSATVIAGAQRVPFTSFTITASEDATVNGVVVKRSGLVGNDSFANVYLVDSKGIRIGKKRSLNRDNEARIGGRFDLRSGQSVTLTVVADMDATNFDSGAIAGLEVIGVESNGSVSGVSESNPIAGARHSFSDPITLQTIELGFRDAGTGSVELNEEEEVAAFRVDIKTSNDDDEEDYYLKSFSFENKGNVNESDIRSVVAEVDRDDYRASVDDDIYTFTLPGRGFLIEDNDRIDVTIKVEFDSGSDDTFQVELDPSDFYFVGASYGYGLPVEIDDGDSNTDPKDAKSGTAYMIGSGSVSEESRVRSLDSDDFDITYGDKVLLGAVEYRVEGEDVEIDTPRFTVALDADGWDNTNVIEELIISNAVLEVDGETAFYADDDIEFTPSNSGKTVSGIDFDGVYTVEANEDDRILFALYGDLDSDWGNELVDGATIQFTLTRFADTESVVSEDNVDSQFLTDSGSTREFRSVTIEGNEYDFSFRSNDVDEDEIVAGTDDVVFGTLRIDARDAVDDIYITDASFTMTAANETSGSQHTNDENANLDYINNCVVRDSRDNEVADSKNLRDSGPSSSNSYADVTGTLNFDFDGSGYRVDAGEIEDLLIQCNVDADAYAEQRYQLSVTTSDTIEYVVDGDDFEFTFVAKVSEEITVKGAGTLIVDTDRDDEPVAAISVGNSGKDGVTLLTFELEAEKEDIEIKDVVLNNIAELIDDSESSTGVADVIEGITVTIGGQSESIDVEDSSDIETGNFDAGNSKTIAFGSTGGIAIEGINVVIPADRKVKGTISVDFKGIDDSEGIDGQGVKFDGIGFAFEGEESDEIEVTSVISTTGDLASRYAFRNILELSTSRSEPSFRTGSQRIYSLTLSGEGESGEDLYVDGFTFNISRQESGDDQVTLSNVEVKVRGSTIGTTSSVGDTDDSFSVNLDDPEEVSVGSSVTFDVYASLTGSNDSYLNTWLPEDSTHALGKKNDGLTGGIVWTPNSLENDDSILDANTNWFNGAGLYDSDNVFEWNLGN